MFFDRKQIFYKFSDFIFKKLIYKSLILFVFIFFTSVFSNLYAQFVIQYPNVSQGMTICMSPSLLTVRVDVGVATTDNNVVTLTLPPGVTCVPGSVTKMGGTAALTIADLGGTPSAPTFQLGPSTLTAGNFIIFTVQREAGCAARTFALGGGTFKDNVTVTGTAGTTVENDPAVNPYNVNFPSLSFAQPPALNNTVVGSSYNRTFSITNGADGCTDEVNFYIVYPGGGLTLNSLTLTGFGAVTPASTSGDTLFFTISGAGVLTADGLLCNGENLQFTENFRVNTCNASTQYRAGWGCSASPSAWCQTASGSGSVSMAAGVGTFSSFSTQILPGYTDMCGTGNGGFINMRAVYGWSGTGNSSAASAFNTILRLGGQTQSNALVGLQSGVYSFIGNVNIGGNPIPSVFSGGFLTINVNNFFAFDPDGPGGLSDMDGDGFFDDLAPGASVSIDFQIQFNCNKPCNLSTETNAGIAGDVRYNLMCGGALLSANRINSGQAFQESGWVANGYIPANITEGVPFRVRVSTGIFTNSNPFRTSSTRWLWYLVLPPGVSVAGSGNPTWNNGGYFNSSSSVSHAYYQSNDTIFFISPSTNVGWGEIDLVYSCASGGNANTLNFNYGLVQINNVSTGCQCRSLMVCGSFTTNTLCPSPCPAGPVNGIPVVRRVDNSLGWTNASMTVRQNAGNISAYDLSKALFLDTIQVRGFARQSNAASNLWLRMELPQTTMAPLNTNKLTPLTINCIIRRGGTIISSGSVSSFSMAASSGGVQRIDWDLTGIIPSGGLLPNDSIETVSKYWVSTNAGLPTNDVQSGGRWYHYNLSGQQRDHCNEFVPEMYLTGTILQNANNTSNLFSCNPGAPGGGTNYLARRFNTAGTLFANEFRPALYIDSVQVLLPAGYEFVSAAYNYTAAFGTPGFSLSLSPSSINGNVVTLVNNGSWLPLGITVTNTYGAILPITIRPNCATLSSEPITYRVFIKDYYYALASLPSYPSQYKGNLLGKTETLIHANKGNLVVSDQTGLVQAAAPQESWTIRLSNIGQGATPYNWLAIPSDPNTTVVGVVDLTTMMAIPSIPYPGGVWYQLSSSGLSPGQSRNYRIDFTYSTCDSDSLIVLAGWNCGSYPADPSSYGCQPRELVLRYAPVSSEVGLYQVSASPDSVNLCTPVYYEYVVNSSQAGNTVSNTFSLNLPQGMFPVPGTFEAEYPLGSGNWFSVPVLVSGTTYVFDLTLHPLYPILTGLPGTLNALGNADRQMGIRFLLTTDCSYIVNTQFVASTGAMQPCGVSAPGAGLLVQGPLTPVAGVEQGYITVNNMLSGDTLLSCSDTAEVDMVTFIVAGTTTSGGFIRIDIPSGLNYVPGSLLCSSGFCPSFSGLTVLPGGTERITLQIPSGLSPGDSMSYSILVSSEPAGNCGLHSIELNTFAESSTVLCASDPGGFCNSVQVFTGQASSDIWVEKPGLVLFSNGPGPVSSSPGNFLLDFGLTQVSGSPFSGGALIELWGITPSGPVLVQDTLFTGLLLPGDSVVLLFNVNSNLCNLTGFQINLPKEVNCICDSSFLVWNTIDTTYQLTQNEVICQGSSFTFGGTAYTTTGNYPYTFQTINGCDSTVILNLTVNPVYTGGVQNEVICQGQSFTFGGTAYTTTGNYPFTFQTINGCDSTVTLNLTVNPVYTGGVQNEVICQGQSFTFGGTAYTTTGNYPFTFQTINGCDSTVTLNLTVNPVYTGGVQNEVICQGQSFTFGGTAYTTSGNYPFTFQSINGCDSTVTLNLTVNPVYTGGVQNEVICQGDSFTFGGTAYTTSGNYPFTFQTINGCDSTVTLNLTVNPVYTGGVQNEVICQGQSFTFGGTAYTTTGNYPFTFQTINGCDSTVTLNLTVNPVYTGGVQNEVICQGQSFTFGGTAYTTTGNYPFTFQTINGCDSTVTLNLTVNPVYTGSVQNEVICQGQSLTFGGTAYTTSGNYPFTFQTINGCDSTVTLNLTVNPVYTGGVQNEVICQGQSFTFGGTAYTTTSNYPFTFQTINGCDSTVTLNLTVNPVYTGGVQHEVICQGQSFTFGGTAYTTTGNYPFTFQTINGCDSTVTLNLTVNPVYTGSVQNEVICQGQSFTFGGTAYTTTGNYPFTFQTINGCDSTVTLNLTVNPVYTGGVQNEVICQGDSFTFGGTAYTTTGNYPFTFQTINGCDSTVTLNLTVNPVYTGGVQNEVICQGQSFTFGGTAYTTSGNYPFTFQTINGCDSTVTLNLTVNPVYTGGVQNEVICQGQSFTFGGTAYTTSGNYPFTFQTINGCDSTVTLNLTVNPVYTGGVQNEVICQGDSFTFGGTAYTTTGNYPFTFQSINGCDSTVTLNLTVNPVYTGGVQNEVICQGQSFTFGGTAYSTSGNYPFTFQSINGCDSTVTLNLTVNPVYTGGVQNEVICQGDSFTFGGTAYTTTGNYPFTFQTINGCDSTVTLNLTVNPVYTGGVQNEVICQGQSFTFGGTAYTTTGNYPFTFQTINGCDSTVTLNLTVNPVYTGGVQNEVICQGQSFTFGGTAYTTTGNYPFTFQTINGCDSTVTLNLTVNPVYTGSVQNEVICQGQSFTFGGTAYTTTGNYPFTFQSINGCDSAVTLNLTVNPVYTGGVQNEVICQGDSFTFGGTAYTTSGNYPFTFQTINGCDSTVTLNLTVNPVYTGGVQNEVICQGDSFTFGGTAYTTTGNYPYTLQTINGCDSTVTLNLTVNPVYTGGVQNEVICQGDSFTFGGTAYTTTGNYPFTFQSINGCDSTVTLNLTVNPVYTGGVQNEVICQGDSFTFGGTAYTTTGNYPFTFQSINGCDSTVTLNLTVNPVYTGGVQNEVICQGDSFTFGGTAYTTSGNYPYTFQTVNGCDSSVVLNLTVNPNPIAGFQLSGNPGDWEQGMPISVYDASIGAESYVYFLSDGFSTSLPSFDFTPNVSGYIFVNQQVTNIYGCWDEMSLPVWVDVPSNVYVPGAFTPGTNGINDVFMVYGNGITEFKMSIFNRWGELLFSSADIHVGWDGYFRGELCKPDVYIYLIEYSTRRAAEQTQRGGFTLIR